MRSPDRPMHRPSIRVEERSGFVAVRAKIGPSALEIALVFIMFASGIPILYGISVFLRTKGIAAADLFLYLAIGVGPVTLVLGGLASWASFRNRARLPDLLNLDRASGEVTVQGVRVDPGDLPFDEIAIVRPSYRMSGGHMPPSQILLRSAVSGREYVLGTFGGYRHHLLAIANILSDLLKCPMVEETYGRGK